MEIKIKRTLEQLSPSWRRINGQTSTCNFVTI